MIYLIDANVLSEPTKPVPDAKVVNWLSAHEGNLVVDSIVLGEVFAGILALPGGRKRAQLEQWFEAVVRTIECLPWDAAIALRWARLIVELRAKGQKVPVLDSMIAATALENGLAVATRNVRDLQKTGVKVLNPFATG